MAIMIKYKVKEVATDLGVTTKDVIKVIKDYCGSDKKAMTALSEEERACFATESSRLKLKTTAEYERRLVAREAVSDEAKEVHDLIDSYNKRIRFIGKIKKFKEDHQL